MGIFEGCLLVSDIDGTLADEGVIPQKNLDAIEYFKSEGGVFAIATGRGLEPSKHICDTCKVNSPSLLSNGALIYDTNKLEALSATYLSREAIEVVKKGLKKFPEIGLELTLLEYNPTIVNTPFTEQHRKGAGISYVPKKMEEVEDKEVLKALFMVKDIEKMQELRDYLISIKPDDCEYIVTSPYFYEILPKGVNKALHLHKLADLLNISYSNVYAIGDYYNDVELIETAEIGAVVKHTPDDIKAKADFVACDVKEGAVADFIYYLAKLKNK